MQNKVLLSGTTNNRATSGTLAAAGSIFICLILIGCVNKKPKLKCEDLRTGRFASSSTNFIIRTVDEQIEVDSSMGFNTKWKIQWLNSCEYLMILAENNSSGQVVFSIGDTMKLRMHNISEDKYDWEANYKANTYHGSCFILTDERHLR